MNQILKPSPDLKKWRWNALKLWTWSIRKLYTLCTSLRNSMLFSQKFWVVTCINTLAIKIYPWLIQQRESCKDTSITYCTVECRSPKKIKKITKKKLYLPEVLLEKLWYPSSHLKFKFTASFCCCCCQTGKKNVCWMQQLHWASLQMCVRKQKSQPTKKNASRRLLMLF